MRILSLLAKLWVLSIVVPTVFVAALGVLQYTVGLGMAALVGPEPLMVSYVAHWAFAAVAAAAALAVAVLIWRRWPTGGPATPDAADQAAPR